MLTFAHNKHLLYLWFVICKYTFCNVVTSLKKATTRHRSRALPVIICQLLFLWSNWVVLLEKIWCMWLITGATFKSRSRWTWSCVDLVLPSTDRCCLSLSEVSIRRMSVGNKSLSQDFVLRSGKDWRIGLLRLMTAEDCSSSALVWPFNGPVVKKEAENSLENDGYISPLKENVPWSIRYKNNRPLFIFFLVFQTSTTVFVFCLSTEFYLESAKFKNCEISKAAYTSISYNLAISHFALGIITKRNSKLSHCLILAKRNRPWSWIFFAPLLRIVFSPPPVHPSSVLAIIIFFRLFFFLSFFLSVSQIWRCPFSSPFPVVRCHPQLRETSYIKLRLPDQHFFFKFLGATTWPNIVLL